MKKVLIIDDDPIFVLIASKLIQRHFPNYLFESFNNGKIAFDYISGLKEEEHPDWILLDINMPIMNGWEFLDELEASSLKQNFKICMVSSSIDPSDLMKANQNSRVVKFLSKPLKSYEIEELLKN